MLLKVSAGAAASQLVRVVGFTAARWRPGELPQRDPFPGQLCDLTAGGDTSC